MASDQGPVGLVMLQHCRFDRPQNHSTGRMGRNARSRRNKPRENPMGIEYLHTMVRAKDLEKTVPFFELLG